MTRKFGMRHSTYKIKSYMKVEKKKIYLIFFSDVDKKKKIKNLLLQHLCVRAQMFSS